MSPVPSDGKSGSSIKGSSNTGGGLAAGLRTPSFWLAFALNQLGSFFFLLALYRLDLSLAQPLCNALTFVATALTGAALGESRPSRRLLLGAALISLGTYLCLSSGGTPAAAAQQ